MYVNSIFIRAQTLHSQLEVLRLPTDELIVRFLSELLEFQRQEVERERQLGTLEVSTCYNKDESAVEVTVVKGEKFPISNKHGNLHLHSHHSTVPSFNLPIISGSFVQLSLLPLSVFPKSGGLFITSTQRKTVDPVYEQMFKM